jgi:hypothetical protein
MRAAPLPLGTFLAEEGTQFGIDAASEPITSLETDTFTWQIYASTFQGFPVDLAVAEIDGTTYYVGLLSGEPAARDALVANVLLPVIEALQPA